MEKKSLPPNFQLIFFPRDINFEVGWEMFKDVSPFRDHFEPPGVEVHCLHGYGVDTTEKLVYTKPNDFPSNYPSLIKGDGDGTVNRRSLEACIHWQTMQSQKVFHVAFPKLNHMNILRDDNVLNYLFTVLKIV